MGGVPGPSVFVGGSWERRRVPQTTDITTEILDLCRDLTWVRKLELEDPDRLVWLNRRRRAVRVLEDLGADV